MYELARWAVAGAFLGSAGAACSSALSARFGQRRCWRLSVVLAWATLGALALATVILLAALVSHDFRLRYVDSYTSTDLPRVYAVSALWAGQAGSLLFWTLLLALLEVLFLLVGRGVRPQSRAVANAVLASLVCFFAGVVVLVTDPFVTHLFPPAEGMGLNPLLQNVQMLFHPPTLYLGYLVFALPFAMVAAALLRGDDIHEALDRTRPWLVGAWALLTLGIVLGMQWAYVELGWGGYWSWDPVENASLVPWLSATALLHTLALVRRRRLQPVWGVALVFATFVLCLLGALLARGGLVTSVHAFARSPLAGPLLGVSVVTALVPAALVVWRRRALTNDQLRAFETRDWLLALTVVLVAGLGVAVTVGTWWPAIVALVHNVTGPSGRVPALTRVFYDRLAVPATIALSVALWACLQRSARTRRWVPIAALVPGALVAFAFLRQSTVGAVWGSVVAVIVALGGASALLLLGRLVWALTRLSGGRAGQGQSRRRSAFLVVHLGVTVSVVALALSEGFWQRDRVVLKPGDTAEAASVTIRLQGRDFTEAPGYEALVAKVTLTDKAGNSTVLSPELRAYRGQDHVNAELAVSTGLREDLLVAIGQASPDGRVALIVTRRPGVLWIWVGGALMVLGAGALALPRRRRPPAKEEDGRET